MCPTHMQKVSSQSFSLLQYMKIVGEVTRLAWAKAKLIRLLASLKVSFETRTRRRQGEVQPASISESCYGHDGWPATTTTRIRDAADEAAHLSEGEEDTLARE